MGIDNVAIKTFNSTGSQSVCRANIADDTKVIESQLLTKCKTEYMNGSGMSFISGTLTDMPANGSNVETYNLPSDVDAISEIILQFRFKCTMTGTPDKALSASFLLDIINKIEMKIGNLTYQTILPGDIYARNLTENGSLLKVEHLGVSTSAADSGIHVNGTYFDFALSIPFTGRNSDLKGCFLQAGGITNSLIMKVTYNIVPSAVSGSASIYNLIELATLSDVSTGICVFSHQITQTEKNFLQNNIVNRVVNASQGLRSLHNFTGSANEDVKLTVDLSSININVSHILLTLERGVYGTSTTTHLGTSGIAKTGSDNKGTCWRPIAESITVTPLTLGVLKGWLKSAELIVGNDRTGAIPSSCITTNRIEQFGLVSTDNKNIYVIKLAESAFSTAGIPFSRLNNKKLVLTFNGLQVQDIANSSTSNQCLLSVTCCGTQVQTTVSGGHSFSG